MFASLEKLGFETRITQLYNLIPVAHHDLRQNCIGSIVLNSWNTFLAKALNPKFKIQNLKSI
jgi:hypothetical protein